MHARSLLHLILAVCVLGALPAFAQYGSASGGSTTGTGGASSGGGYGGSGAAIGIGVAAAAGAAIAYLALHKPSVVGCLESSSDGMKLMNEQDKKIYTILAGSEDLKAGDRVQLRGKKTKNKSGKLNFQVRKLVKNFGSCTPGRAHAQANLKHE